jgi:Tfp pilus assembly protein PilO
MNKKPPSFTRWWRIDAVGIIALALVTVLCYAALIRPSISNQLAYEQLKPQATERTQQVQDARSSLTSLQAELDRTRVELQDLPLRLESSTRVNSRLAGIAELAAEMGLEVHQLLPDSVSAGQRYDVVPIVLTGSGDYARVTRFMRRVNDDFADVAVVGFALTSVNPTAQSASFDIGLAWYTLPAIGLVEN